MSGMSKLGITLTSLFSLLLLALISEIIYLLWRRRQRSHRKNNRIEPTIPALSPNPVFNFHPQTMQLQLSEQQSEALKLDDMYGHARVLFTIKEEEREDMETDDFSSFRDGIMLETTMSLSQHFSYGDDNHVICMVGDDQSSDFDVEPSFLTPCASPPYYTPSTSPTR